MLLLLHKKGQHEKHIETIQEEIVEPHICIQLFPFYVMVQSKDPSQIVRGQWVNVTQYKNCSYVTVSSL